MSTYAEILAKLKGLHTPISYLFPATIKTIDTETTCTIVLPDGMEMPGVRLKAAVDEKKEFLIIKPREKSTVLVGLIGDEDIAGEYYIASCNEVDEIVLKIKDLEALITKEGILAKLKDTSIELLETSLKATLKDGGLVMDSSRAAISYKNNYLEIDNSTIKLEGKTGTHLDIASNNISLKDVIKGVLDCIQNLKIVVTGTAGIPDITTMQNVTAAKLKVEQLFS